MTTKSLNMISAARSLEQHYPIELSVVMEMFCLLCQVQQPLASCGYGACDNTCMVERLDFYFYLILINVNHHKYGGHHISSKGLDGRKVDLWKTEWGLCKLTLCFLNRSLTPQKDCHQKGLSHVGKRLACLWCYYSFSSQAPFRQDPDQNQEPEKEYKGTLETLSHLFTGGGNWRSKMKPPAPGHIMT